MGEWEPGEVGAEVDLVDVVEFLVGEDLCVLEDGVDFDHILLVGEEYLVDGNVGEVVSLQVFEVRLLEVPVHLHQRHVLFADKHAIDVLDLAHVLLAAVALHANILPDRVDHLPELQLLERVAPTTHKNPQELPPRIILDTFQQLPELLLLNE